MRNVSVLSQATRPVKSPATSRPEADAPIPGPGPGGRALTAAGLLCQGLGLCLVAATTWRQGEKGLAAAILLLAIPAGRRWRPMPLLLGPALLLGGWGLAAAVRPAVLVRLGTGEPVARLLGITAGAVAVCLVGGLFSLSGRAKAWWRRGPDSGPAMAASFWLTVGLLVLARGQARLPLLLADRFLPGWGPLEIVVLALYAAWLTGRLLDAKPTASLRLGAWAAFSLLFFGQLALGLAGVDACLMTGNLHLPVPAVMLAGPLYRGEGLFMPLLFAGTVLLVGPGWCSQLCYIGALDGLMAASGRRVARALPGRLVLLRLVSLGLTVSLALAYRVLGVGLLTAVWTAAGFGLLGLLAMVALSRRAGVMIHCSMLCPMGLLANWLGKLSPWRLRLAAGCDGCGRCVRACRYLALSPERLAQGSPGLSCTLCGDCLDVCPGRRLQLRFPGLSPRVSRQAYLALVVALHAVFCGLARM